MIDGPSDRRQTPETILARIVGDTAVTGREHEARDGVINDIRRHQEERDTWPADEPLDVLHIALLDTAFAACTAYLAAGLGSTVGRRAHATMAEVCRQLVKNRTSIDETQREAVR